MWHDRIGRVAMLIVVVGLMVRPVSGQPSGRSLGEKYALLVGVHEYDPNELRSLPYTEPDVVELAQVLRDAGYQRVVLMTQAEGAQHARFLPLAKNIRAELKGLLEDRDPEDSVVVAFAGHGVQFRDARTSYFCPMDAKLADPTTLIALDEVYRDLERCGSEFKLLLVDACRNDPQSDNARASSLVRLESVTRPKLAKPPGGVAALFSCSEGEKAYENARLKHGVFYHFVIRGLRGEAALDRDGQVELDELARFARKRVPDFVKEEYGPDVRQMPVLRGEIRGLPVLVSLERSRPPDVTLPRPATRPLESPKTLTNSIGMKLALIPAGEFLMGSPDSDKDASDSEKPQHRVQITRPFYLGAYEVTQEEYEKVMGRDPSNFSAQGRVKSQVAGQDTRRYPVELVSWDDAIQFCNKLSEREGLKPYYQFGAGAQSGGDGYRLPTEAEWEYACRAGTATRYGFGDDEKSLGEYAWYGDNSGDQPHPVGQKRPNAFGLYDMHGNVKEWCWDWSDSHFYTNTTITDPAGPSQARKRVIRSGSWEDHSSLTRSAHRGASPPGSASAWLGFRVARVQSDK
jgi:formylglycine-generating enzyme required for sulfatase activity